MRNSRSACSEFPKPDLPVRPDIKLHAIPQGLQVERGPDAIVEHLLEKVPVLLDS
jgi:hypothetical protein